LFTGNDVTEVNSAVIQDVIVPKVILTLTIYAELSKLSNKYWDFLLQRDCV